MQLPPELMDAIEQEIASRSAKSLASGVSALSHRYRSGEGVRGGRFVQSPDDAAAYALYRMPATYAAAFAVLSEVGLRLPRWQPKSLLDVGAGPGTVMWAATDVFPAINRVTSLEREDAMMTLGKRLAKQSVRPAVRNASWIKADVTRSWDVEPHELVVSAYVLGELPEASRLPFIDALWQLTDETNDGVLVLIEPGTPDGFGRIRAVRDHLLREEANMIAPCPHAHACPIAGTDWCHFSQRLQRTRLHRQVKAGELSYEDEKFSYVAVGRKTGSAIRGRIVRHPQIRKGHIGLQVCTPEGSIASINVTRKNREVFRQARDVRWGQEWPFSSHFEP